MAVVVQKNDCPCILLTGFGFVSCLIKGIILLHLRYIELYSYFITFVWFLLYANVNCVLIVSPPLNAILYYALPHRKFPEAFGAQALKHRHQEVITKVDETVTCKFIYGQAVVL